MGVELCSKCQELSDEIIQKKAQEAILRIGHQGWTRLLKNNECFCNK